MANIIRSTKSGNNWTSPDLLAYNIRISTTDTEEFFGVPHLPATTVDPIILNHVEAPVDSHLPREIREFFLHLRNVATLPNYDDDPAAANRKETSFVVDLSFHILSLLGFTLHNGVMVRGRDFRFIVCGEQVKAKFDLALLDSNHHIVLILEDKNPFPQDHAESRLVAKALAAFRADCDRTVAAGHPPMLFKTYFGIVMTGSVPHFYKIPITEALVDAVGRGKFPDGETIVQRFIPPAPNTDEGMLQLDNRRVFFQCFEALAALL